MPRGPCTSPFPPPLLPPASGFCGCLDGGFGVPGSLHRARGAALPFRAPAAQTAVAPAILDAVVPRHATSFLRMFSALPGLNRQVPSTPGVSRFFSAAPVQSSGNCGQDIRPGRDRRCGARLLGSRSHASPGHAPPCNPESYSSSTQQ